MCPCSAVPHLFPSYFYLLTVHWVSLVLGVVQCVRQLQVSFFCDSLHLLQFLLYKGGISVI